MATLSLTQKKRVKRSFGALIGAAMTVYFGVHAVSGERGLLAYRAVSAEHAAAQAELATLTAEAETLRTLVTGLHPETLDADLLEERARLLLNYGRPGDVVVLLPTDREQGASGG